MTKICCKGCGSVDLVKNGFVRTHQRYLCKSCGLNFTNTPARGKPAAMKAWALTLYTLGNMSFCGIGRVLGVSDVAVLNWVRAGAKALPDVPAPLPAASSGAVMPVIILDEMWHFVKKRLENSGYGELSIQLEKQLSRGSLENAMMQPARSFPKRPE